jgi:NAD(P)-dependent dehydrogenase (short-subunit alcohol dehydrogenase family)
MDFKDKVVAITGGATGIGFALAKALGQEGARIVIGEPREAYLEKAVEALGALGIEARSFVMDVTDLTSMEAFADFAWAAFGRVDLLINNAGVAQRLKPVTDLPVEEARRVMDVNFFGVWHGCAVFGKRMKEQGSPAAIYNLASENAFFTAMPNMAAYVASKHAVLGLSEAFREEMPDFVHVGTIFPGFVQSDLTGPDFGKYAMETDRFAGIVLRQMREGAHFIVSHAYNMERIEARHNEIVKAFRTYAPRYDGDDEFDVRTVVARMQGEG